MYWCYGLLLSEKDMSYFEFIFRPECDNCYSAELARGDHAQKSNTALSIVSYNVTQPVNSQESFTLTTTRHRYSHCVHYQRL